MRKALLILLSFGLFNVTFFLYSCSKDNSIVPEPDPTTGLTKVTEGYATGAGTKVSVYSKETIIITGYTKFYLALYDSVSGKRIEEAHIQLTPMMDMGMMQHSTPYENPVSEEAVNHLFPCNVVFIMSSMGGTWTLKIKVHNHQNDKEGYLTIPITVNEPAKARIKSFTAAHDGGKYFAALVDPSFPKVGINDMEIAIYKKVSMMSFPADSSLSTILTPEMPTMNHGSPNNINPVHFGKGHYKGKVNFTMTGWWRLHMDYMSGSAVADTTQYFDVEF